MSVVSETPTRPFATGPIPVKIVIAGGFGVGKTTFVGALSDIAPLTTEAAMTSYGEGVDDRGDVSTKTASPSMTPSCSTCSARPARIASASCGTT